MPQLPMDPVEMEQTVRSAIYDVFMSVPLVAQYVKVHKSERFPDSDDEDEDVSTVEDPVTKGPMTSIIQIGLPSVSEKPYVSEQSTQLDMEYPITYDLGVRDIWKNPPAGFTFPNSSALFMAVYMRSRAKFKESKILGVFENCEHEYLQQVSANSVEDEETGGHLHAADWSLMVHVKGVTV